MGTFNAELLVGENLCLGGGTAVHCQVELVGVDDGHLTEKPFLGPATDGVVRPVLVMKVHSSYWCCTHALGRECLSPVDHQLLDE